MVHYRRLDPLANAGPFQRLQKSPVKSFGLTEAQYERVREQRPELLVTHGESAVIGVPAGDFLEIHYAYPEVEHFRDNFVPMTQQVIESSSKEEAPRGVVLAFRDSPNRALAQMLFWPLFLEEGRQWVEMNLVLPEQPEPSDSLEGGFTVREMTDADRGAIADIEAEATGHERLTDAGVASLIDDARWTRIVTDEGGKQVAFLRLRTDPGGWGIIQDVITRRDVADALRKPLLEWAIGFLRNNGGRRIRRRTGIDESAELALLREKGFTPGDTGLDCYRPVDAEEIKSMNDERKAHGSLISFGDWR